MADQKQGEYYHFEPAFIVFSELSEIRERPSAECKLLKHWLDFWKIETAEHEDYCSD